MEKICGNCHYYANSPLHGPWCTKNRKEVSYLQTAFDCWTEPEIVNNLLVDLEPVITLQAATDDQLVEELKRRGYTGNIIRKTSFIL